MMVHKAPTTARRQNLSKLLGFTPTAELVRARDTLAQLRALHRPFGIYPECSCPWVDDLDGLGGYKHDGGEVVNCGDFETCLPPTEYVCAHCCRDVSGDYFTLECAEHHQHGPGKPHCQTAAILAGAR